MRRPQELDDPDRHGREVTTEQIFDLYRRHSTPKVEKVEYRDSYDLEDERERREAEFVNGQAPELSQFRIPPQEDFFAELPRSAGMGRVIGWMMAAVAIGVALSIFQRWIES